MNYYKFNINTKVKIKKLYGSFIGTSYSNVFAQGCTEARFWGKSGALHLFTGCKHHQGEGF